PEITHTVSADFSNDHEAIQVGPMRIIVKADGTDLVTATHAESGQALSDRVVHGRVIMAYGFALSVKAIGHGGHNHSRHRNGNPLCYERRGKTRSQAQPGEHRSPDHQ